MVKYRAIEEAARRASTSIAAGGGRKAKRKGRYVYRIRNADGQYSLGGSSPRFGPRGKLWVSLGALKNHIHCAGYSAYEDCTIVESELVDNGPVMSVDELAHELREAKEKKTADQRRAAAERRVRRAQEELERAQRAYDPYAE